MKTFVFHGRLGSTIGEKFVLDVETIGEGLRAVQCITKRLFDYLLDSDKRGVGYKVVIDDGRNVTHETELIHRFEDKDASEIHFYPMLAGSGNSGLFQILLGVVLVVAAVWSGGATLAANGVFGSIGATISAGGAAGFFASMGVAMVLGGISSLLIGQPKIGEMGERTDQNASYEFIGPVNTTRQGGPIPVGYGEMIIGSQVIALSVRSTRIPSDTGTGYTEASGGSGEVGPGGSGGIGLNPYPSGFPNVVPIDWNRLPEPIPIPLESPS